MHITPEEIEAVERRCYDALWGYDGLGSIGPKESYEDFERKRRADLFKAAPASPDLRPSFEQARNHKRGHSWKANHES